MSYDYQANFTGSPLATNIQYTQVATDSNGSPLLNNLQYSQVGTVSPLTNTIQHYSQVVTPTNSIQYAQVATPANSLQYTQINTPLNVSYVTVPQVNGGIYSPLNTGVSMVSPLMSNIYYFGSVTTPISFNGNVMAMNSVNTTPVQTDVQLNQASKIVSEDMAKKYTLVGYNSSPPTKPCGRDNKAGWYNIHEKHVVVASQRQASVVLCGDSIIAGLSRYSMVWNKHFKPLNAVNCGIGGDRTQHVLWRMENMKLPTSVRYIVLHCGTNNIDRDSAQEIANGVISCGLVLHESNPDLKVVVTGLLPRDLGNSRRRLKIINTNKYLQKFCKRFSNFSFMKQDSDWVLEDGMLNEQFYYSDHLHLIEKGNNKFATSIINILTKISNNEEIEYSSDEEDANASFERVKGEIRQITPTTTPTHDIRKTEGGSKKKRKRVSSSLEKSEGASSKRTKTNEVSTHNTDFINSDVNSSNILVTPTKPSDTPKMTKTKKDYFSLTDKGNNLTHEPAQQNGVVSTVVNSPNVITIVDTSPSDYKNKPIPQKQQKRSTTSAPSALVLKIKKSMEQARKELSKKKFEVSLQGYDSQGDSSQGESTPPKVSMRKLITDYGSSSDTE